MCMHMQTVAIIGSLRLAWPPAVESTFNWFGLAAFQLPAVKPECLIDAGEMGMFFLMSASKLGLLVSMHLLLIGLRAGFTLLKRPGKADRVFVLHSFLYVLSYVFSVNLCLQVNFSYIGGDDENIIAGAFVLIALNATIIFEQWCTLRMLRLQRGELKEGASPRKDALARRVVWGQSCAALLVTAAAAAAHAKVRPFKYGFQNSLETGLFASDDLLGGAHEAGLFYGGGTLLGWQILGVLVITAWTALITALFIDSLLEVHFFITTQ